MKTSILGCLAVALTVVGCASNQQFSVVSNTPGAEVWLIKRGSVQVAGRVEWVHVRGEEGKFEDPPLYLGTAPLTYEFNPRERQEAMAIGSVAGSVTKVTTDFIVLGRKNGASVDRRLPVTKKATHIELNFEPKQM